MRIIRYGGVDPPPEEPSADDILRALADDLAYDGDLASALARLVREGFGATPGLASMLEQLRARRDALLRRYDPAATLSSLRDELDAIVSEERAARHRAYAATGDETHLLAELELDALSWDLAERLSALERYEFLDPNAGERFENLLRELRSSALGRAWNTLADALEGGGGADLTAMLEELASLVERFAAGEPIDEALRTFQGRYPGLLASGESFDELLARLLADRHDLDRLLASLDGEARRAFERLTAALSGSPEVVAALDRLAQALSRVGGHEPTPLGFRGTEAIPLGALSEVLAEIGRLDALEAALSQASTPDRLAALDLTEVEDVLGRDAAEHLDRLSHLGRILRDAGFIDRRAGSLELSPRALWRLGDVLMRDLTASGTTRLLGAHEVRERGVGIELTGERRPWQPGDAFRLAVTDTVRNALLRQGPQLPLTLDPDDFLIEEVDHRERRGTVLALDLSLSMPLNDTFLPAKRVALALAALVRGRFPTDDFGVIVFSELARELRVEELPRAQWDYAYGTNIAHALALARRRLSRVRGRRQLLLVTDGEPTAHVDDDGQVRFAYPPTRETLRRTLAEVVRATRAHIDISVFVLSRDPRLRDFVDQLVALNRGRAYYPGEGELGQVLLRDFLDARHRAGPAPHRAE